MFPRRKTAKRKEIEKRLLAAKQWRAWFETLPAKRMNEERARESWYFHPIAQYPYPVKLLEGEIGYLSVPSSRVIHG